jgi:hypothetical protein
MATTDSATYDVGEDGIFVFCTPLLTKAAMPAAAAAKAGTTVTFNKWDSGVTAITKALSFLEKQDDKHVVVVTEPPISTSVTADKGEVVTKPEKFGTWPRPASAWHQESNSVLHQLLNVAHAIGNGPTAITPAQHVLFRLRLSDSAAADGQIASGSLKIVVPNLGETRAPFVIYAPSVRARTIVIVITVGGVKVTITVRW